jgi:uncharacterized protein (DUF427 family)
MALTVGTGPFGPTPGGRLNFPPPAEFRLDEPLGRRLRAVRDGRTVVDSDRVRLVHESGQLPYYAIPATDVDLTEGATPAGDDLVRVAWEAVDAWYEEDERVFVHPRDPYHRIDTYATSRRVRAELDGEVLADSTRVLALHETGLPARWYFPPSDVNLAALEPSDTVTECAYKGTAAHLSARVGGRLVPDVAWRYGGDEVRREGESVRGRIAFYNERVDLSVDGARAERPRTGWSRE